MKVQGGLASNQTVLDLTVQKVSKRLLGFLLLLYVFAHLDRINIGFAALSMNQQLGLNATAFGFAATVFSIAYFLCEIPSNLMLAKYGAKIWIPRIMITWGIASAATMLAVGPNSLYLIRILVGAAEAGFVPGVLLYLTYWFPQARRAGANAIFMIAQPLAIALGAPVSGLILDNANGLLGLTGWKWLFIIEGAPAVVLGVVAYFYLTNRPSEAKWLSATEKAALQEALDAERPVGHSAARSGGSWRGLLRRDVMLLALTYFGLAMTLNAISTWVPQIVREVLASRSFSSVGLFNAIPAICAVIAMPLWSARSDRRMERTWHIVCPMLLAAVGWTLVALSAIPELRLLGLVFCTVGAFTTMTVFWTVPGMLLSQRERPVGIALINSCGIVGAATSPMVIGTLRDMTNSFAPGLLCIGVVLVAAAGLILLVTGKPAPAITSQQVHQA